MNTISRTALAVAAATFAAQAAAQMTFYEHTNFQGRSFTTDRQIGNLESTGFNNQASSAVVRGESWQVCDGASFSGRCVILKEGQYSAFRELGLNDAISSVRIVGRDARAEEPRYSPPAAAAPPAQPGPAQITFYENEGFAGGAFTTERQVRDFERFGFHNRASSVAVGGERWEVCEGTRFSGRCKVLRPGNYASLAAMGLSDGVASVRAVNRDTRIPEARYAPAPAAAQASLQAVFYEAEGFRGRSFTTDQPVRNLERSGFDNRASSAEVVGGAWEACDGIGYSGRCVVLRPGRYASLSAMGLNDGASSVRAAGRHAGIEDSPHGPSAGYDYRRRNNERLYQANVTSVRAVVGTPEQRCWVEQEQIPQDRRAANVPAAIAGAVIGGILGHQIGSGTRRDIATVGGAVAGGALGSQVGRGDAQPARTQDVQRCESVPSAARPDYWDVTYMFRGQEYRMQMTVPPGQTVTVNERGEPRA